MKYFKIINLHRYYEIIIIISNLTRNLFIIEILR